MADVKAGTLDDAQFEVLLDGGIEQPERSGTLIVHAKDAAHAKQWAEQQNPGLTATDAKQLG